MSMDQQETFNWLVQRSNDLNDAIAVADLLGIEPPQKGDPRWWLRAEPSPVECESFAECLRESAEMWERETAKLRAELAASRKRVEELEDGLAGTDYWAREKP